MPTRKMSDHQCRLVRRMIRSVDNYRAGKRKFASLVGELEGAMVATELKDEDLVKRWYDCWGPLEIHNAVKGNEASQEEVARDVDAMRRFLLEVLRAAGHDFEEE